MKLIRRYYINKGFWQAIGEQGLLQFRAWRQRRSVQLRALWGGQEEWRNQSVFVRSSRTHETLSISMRQVILSLCFSHIAEDESCRIKSTLRNKLFEIETTGPVLYFAYGNIYWYSKWCRVGEAASYTFYLILLRFNEMWSIYPLLLFIHSFINVAVLASHWS